MVRETKPYKGHIKANVYVPDVRKDCELAVRQGLGQGAYWNEMHKKSVLRTVYHPHVNGFSKPDGPNS